MKHLNLNNRRFIAVSKIVLFKDVLYMYYININQTSVWKVPKLKYVFKYLFLM